MCDERVSYCQFLQRIDFVILPSHYYRMHFIYIDDSTDRPLNVFSAMCVPCDRWNETFERIKKWRQHLKEVHNIPLNFELHAQSFISGRNSAGEFQHLSRHNRAQILHTSMKVTNWLNGSGVTLFNVCNRDDDQFRAFERLLNRINRTMQARNSFAHLICDGGKENQYKKLVRKMRVHNHIPSRFGTWDDGAATRNITIDRIIEDPQFKDSKESYFIQHVDFIAFALLRREVPTPKIKRYGIHKSFDVLKECLELVASPRDPKGVIR